MKSKAPAQPPMALRKQTSSNSIFSTLPKAQVTVMQMYNGILLLLDVMVLFVFLNLPPQQLSISTLWFDFRQDQRETVPLFFLVMLLLIASDLLSTLYCMNTWILLHHCGMEFLRCGFFLVFFRCLKVRNSVDPLLEGWVVLSALVQLKNWYGTKCFIEEESQQGEPSATSEVE